MVFYGSNKLLALCVRGDVRLNVGSDYDYTYGLLDYEDFYYSENRQLTRGRVEVCTSAQESQEWGTVCTDQWDNEDASVICVQLQFSRHGKCLLRQSVVQYYHHSYDNTGAIAVEGSQFGDVSVMMTAGSINCSGMEAELSECAFVVSPVSCVGGGIAGVVCQGNWICGIVQD